MRVSLLTFAQEWGGAEVHSVALAKTLGERGHQVTIVELGHDTYRRRLGDPEPPVRLLHMPLSRPLPRIGWREAHRLVRKLPRDACIFAKGHFDAGDLALDVAARLWFKRYITIEHLPSGPMPRRTTRRHLGGLLPGLGLWWYYALAARYARSLSPHLVVAVSEASRRNLIDHCRFPARKVVTVHNGIDPSKFLPDRDGRRVTRQKWGIREDAFVFGAVGRLSEQKQYDVAISLFADLARTLPDRDLRLVLVGDGPCAHDLSRTAEATGLRDRIEFKAFTDHPWEALVAFDVFLLPSKNEGLPLALLEAMACGCCPVAMGAGGVPEVVSDPSLGWLVPGGDHRAFLTALRAAAESTPDTLAEMGRRARLRVISDFSAERQFAALADLIELQLGGRPRPHIRPIGRLGP